MSIAERRIALTPLAQALLALHGSDGVVAIYPHLNADGDAYGSSQGLALALQGLGLKAICVYEEAVAEGFRFLPGQELVVNWHSLSHDERAALTARQSMAIQIDVSVDHRLAERRQAYRTAPNRKILDHHVNSVANNQDNFIYTDAAASSELVYILIEALEEQSGQTLMTSAIAVCLYTGIIMDTGNFCYANVRSTTLAVAAELLKFEIDLPGLTDRLFNRISWARYLVEGALRQHTRRSADGRITYLGVSRELMEAYHASDDDLEAIPGQLRDIEGTDVALMIRQTSHGSLRGNLRSQPEIDIQEFAAELGGGGHRNAAGFTLPPADLDATLADLVARLEKKLEQH